MVPVSMHVFVGLLAGCSDYDITPQQNASALATRLEAVPAVVDVGGVPVDGSTTTELQLVNLGNEPIQLIDMALAGSSAFSFDLPETDEVPVGGEVTVRIGYAPDALEEEAVLEVWFDTLEQADGMLPVPLQGIGLAGVLSVDPPFLDLGEYPEGCVVEDFVTLTNDGTDKLELQDLAVLGEGFFLPDSPKGEALAPGASIELAVAFEAAPGTSSEGELWIEHDGVAGLASADVAAGMQPRAYTEETFLQDGPWDMVDILFAVDGSGSMQDDTARLAENARTFFQALHALGVDAQVAGVTRDDGCANGVVSTRDPGAEDAFARLLDGEWGTETESLLTVATRALEAHDGCNYSVFREGARPAVVFLSDEPDQSDNDWDTYVARMLAVDPHVVLSAIVGPVPDGCETAYPGYGYVDAAAATGGATVSLCAEDWGAFLNLQAELVTGNPRTHFELSEPAGPGEAYVFIDGERILEGWTIDRTSHELVFEDHRVPGPGASIFVEYPRAADCDPAP